MRLDKYLKISRLIKRRTVANEACGLGRVSVNNKVAKPSAEVKAGDELAIRMGGKTLRVKVLATPEFAPKADAAALYTLLEGQPID